MLSGITTALILTTLQISSSGAGGPPQLRWQEDYETAMRVAKREGRMLLVYFHQDEIAWAQDPLIQKLNSNGKLRALADRYVLVHVPLSTRESVGGKMIRLVDHEAFDELQAQPGLVVIDVAKPESQFYGRVVSIYPMSLPDPLATDHLAALLDLPPGSLTQRTLVLAVRLHPEKPASSDGELLADMVHESENQAQYQANVTYQGHQHWESRFHRIIAKLPPGYLAQEVCAESWPGQGLIAAAVECVHSWRQSSGHWSAVRARHAFYGYDMKRGRNGVWYATGIFSTR